MSDSSMQAPEVTALQNATAQLAEWFDDIQIMASRYGQDQTESFAWGTGNWHARIGMCKTLVDKDRAKHLANALRAPQEPPEDEHV